METPKNLLKSYIGKSIAINRYTIYSDIARGENLIYVSKYFKEVIENEKKHAEIFQFLTFNGVSEIFRSASELYRSCYCDLHRFNINLPNEVEVCKAEELYPKLAEIAEKEGFEEVAKRVRTLAEVEKSHQRKFAKLLELLETGRMFKRDKEVEWLCLVCGYVHRGKEPAKVCPNCGAIPFRCKGCFILLRGD